MPPVVVIAIAGDEGLRRMNWGHDYAQENKPEGIGWSRGLEEPE